MLQPNILELLRTALSKASSAPDEAAAALEAASVRLLEWARRLREQPDMSHGGSADRVKIKVLRPDGTVRQEADTAP